MSARPDTTPAYTQMADEEFAARVDELWERYADCDLCAYECGVDRTAGETGACRVGDTASVSAYFDHHGEEDVLRGHNGSGTIFLAHCNMTCVFCQNFETSHEAQGDPATPTEIAEMALDLQSRGCHNVNFVSPTHHSPHLVEAIRIARDRGLELPVVWNCGGYERTEVLELLDGIVDIYMPDVKWSDDDAAVRYSKAPEYWSNIKKSLREMHRQVGDLDTDTNGLATNGLLVRHLVMPNHVENTEDILSFLASEISEETFVNLMGQYRPHYRARSEDRYGEINRRITKEEYQAALTHVREVGLERIEYDPAMTTETGGSLWR
jgi:putative pyruvate formate lyase activating enzyme